MAGLMANPRGFMPRGTVQCTRPCGEPPPSHASTGGPPTPAGSLGSVCCGVTALLWVLVHAKFCLCPPRLESLFPSVLWKAYNQIPLALKARSLGIPSPFVGSPGWETWCGVQNLHSSARTSLVLLFSNLWVTHLAGMGFDLIMIVPFLPSCCGFFFVFACELSSFGFQHPPVNGCSTASCNFGSLPGGEERTSFYSAILNRMHGYVFKKSLSFKNSSWKIDRGN